ncbi:hypothetical protein Cni_G07515 [Canna indica]|uniref:Uncharacterized protein n=1 Tax=Canna indica TaxID=4628 RepID=A0AAQ3K0F3_9LILI|nr:hypothetical protein Cni_G07515 [Canna indica]
MKKTLLAKEKALFPSPCMTPRASEPARVKSVTRDEIDLYWRMRRMVEEDHLLAAQKAAARIRAKTLKEDDYQRFEDSVKEMLNSTTSDEGTKEGKVEAHTSDDSIELWVGIKNWWTRSKFAYLNQPVIKSMMENSTPQCPASAVCSCYLSPAVMQFYHSSSIGIF